MLLKLNISTSWLWKDLHGGYWCIIMMDNVMALLREDKLVERAKALKVNAGTEPDADVGPVICKPVSSYVVHCIISSSMNFEENRNWVKLKTWN